MGLLVEEKEPALNQFSPFRRHLLVACPDHHHYFNCKMQSLGFSDPMLTPHCNTNHKLWWETKLTTCCDCTVGKMRFRNMNQYHNAQVWQKQGPQQAARLADRQIKNGPSCSSNSYIYPWFSRCTRKYSFFTAPHLWCLTQTDKWQLFPILMKVHLHYICVCLCVITCIFICVVSLVL